MQTVYDKKITNNFNFKRIERGENKYKLRRVTASTNLSMKYGHLLSKLALKQDDNLVESTLHGKSVIETRNLFESLRSNKDWDKSRLLVERSMFPNNRKVREEFDKVFGKGV